MTIYSQEEFHADTGKGTDQVFKKGPNTYEAFLSRIFLPLVAYFEFQIA
jgi:hypothetical protein